MEYKIISEETNPKRLDKYIIDLELEDIYSRSQIEKLIKEKHIMVNGSVKKKSYTVECGDEIYIDVPKSIRDGFELLPENIPLEIIYEDQYLTVVNKQAGVTVHPAIGNPKGTLVNALLYRYGKELSSGSKPERPGIVHRLDKDTTGLIIVARDDKTHALLGNMFRERNIKKTYLAITCGIPSENMGRIETFLDRSKTDRRKMAVTETGKYAITNYIVKEYFNYHALLEVGLETGRTHQIRVHMSHLNCPVLGDRLYSSTKREDSLIPGELGKRLHAIQNKYTHRQMLHAWRLKFTHPITNQLIDLEAPLKGDFKETLGALERAGL